MVRSITVVAALTILTSCAALEANTQGPMQPQTVAGPCTVKPFFLLGFRSVPAEMNINNTGQACTLTLIHPALSLPINASLLTGPAQHGQAQTGLISGARQAIVTYTPAPGYVGPDKFSVTLEPNAVGITMNVTVTQGR